MPISRSNLAALIKRSIGFDRESPEGQLREKSQLLLSVQVGIKPRILN